MKLEEYSKLFACSALHSYIFLNNGGYLLSDEFQIIHIAVFIMSPGVSIS